MERLVDGSDGRVVIDLDRVTEVHVRVVGGEIAVGGTGAPPRLEVEWLRGPPVHVWLDDGVVVVEHEPERPGGFLRQGPRAAVAITVPPGTPVSVHSVAAGVLTAGLGGDIEVKTVSGPVTATYLSGAVDVATVAGEIEVEAVSGQLRASSVSGNITVHAASLSALGAKSVSGVIAADLDVKPAGRYEARTTSGDILLRLCPEASAAVEAKSFSGRLDDGYSEPGTSSRGRLRLRLGEADANITAESLSGDIAVLRQATVDA